MANYNIFSDFCCMNRYVLWNEKYIYLFNEYVNEKQYLKKRERYYKNISHTCRILHASIFFFEI